MCFKLKLLLGTLLMVTLACSNKRGFQEDKEVVINLSFNTKCFSELRNTWDRYLEERAQEQDIKSVFSCVSEALSYLQKRAIGENKNQYTQEEIKNIFDRFLFKEEITPDLYKAFFKIKSDLVGGTDSAIQFQELDRIQILLSYTQDFALKIRPLIKEFRFKEDLQNKSKAQVVAKNFQVYLNQILGLNSKGLRLDAVEDFLKALDTLKTPGKWVNLVKLILGLDTEVKTLKEERKTRSINQLSQILSLYLEFNYSFSKEFTQKRTHFLSFKEDVEKTFELLERALSLHPKQEWKEEDLKNFTFLINVSNVFSVDLTEENQSDLLKFLFGNLLKKGSDIKSNLDLAKLQYLKEQWLSMKKFIQNSKELEGYTGQNFPIVYEGDSNFDLYTQSLWPNVFTENGSIFFYNKSEPIYFDFINSFHQSWAYVLSDMVIESYSADKKNLTEKNIEEVYKDVFKILNPLGVLEDDAFESWLRVFNEGDLFVSSSKANGLIDRQETAEYFTHTFSAYFSGKVIYDNFLKLCVDPTESCTWEKFEKEPEQIIPNLPSAVGYLKSDRAQEDVQRWRDSFEYIAKVEFNDSPFEQSQYFRGAIALQYTEIIYRKYDLDRSGFVDFKEVYEAYPDFKVALKIVAGKVTNFPLNDRMLRGFLTYFIKNSRVPSTTELLKHAAICSKANTTKEDCLFESDRSRILYLFMYLTEIL